MGREGLSPRNGFEPSIVENHSRTVRFSPRYLKANFQVGSHFSRVLSQAELTSHTMRKEKIMI